MGFGLTVGLGAGRDADMGIQDGVEDLHVKVDCLSALIYLVELKNSHQEDNDLDQNFCAQRVTYIYISF